MSYEFIKTERQGNILIVTMNRPEVYNAVHAEMHQEMSDCWDAFAADPDLWVAVLTGAGNKAFTAGNDLKATAKGGSKKTLAATGFAGLSSRFDLEKPIIAADTAKFALPEVKVGFFASASGVQRLSRYIGRLAAQELMLSGRTIDAAEALRLGCVNEVVPADQLMERAMEKATELAGVSPSSIKATKRILNSMAVADGLPESLNYSREVQMDLAQTEDFKEGVKAFVEKRAPKWVNR